MRRWLAALAAAVAFPALAQDGARWYLQIDNDVVFATDRWYTSGVRLARVQRHGDHAVEWGLVQDVYTPESKHFQLGQVDRAPTARLQLAVARHDARPDGLVTLELRAGVRGKAALGERSTELIHRVIAAPEVDWSRESETRADVQAAVVRTQRAGPLHVHYGAVLGNQLTFAHAGLELRTGAGGMEAAYSPVMRHAATPPFDVSTAASTGWNAFAGAGVRGVARNRLLDRSYDPVAPAPDRERWVGRFALGLAGANAWGTVVFALVQETREFASQRVPQRFGSLIVHVPF